ncbi:pullulanase, extracellular [Gracilibacillus ureilyticus]|uniref:pullulanase n=1 Tax=Gracilibacillus ureilyticus TaxID=531814 RepID=A0A1H9R562_9BACI|nr:pullulanase [Gracilibacillus ureilyticus]SER67856.1 pullulanase, extracellular [Gracilibacillus ureilyticus]
MTKTKSQENTLRVHFPGNEAHFDEIGLWIWRDVEYPSETVGSWPDGALSFLPVNTTSYGRFIDIELADDAETAGLLINNRNGDNLSGDLYVKIFGEKLTEVWLNGNYQIFYYEPLQNRLRVHFDEKEVMYNKYWLSVIKEGNIMQTYLCSEEQPYIDIDSSTLTAPYYFIAGNHNTGWETGKLTVPPTGNHSQLFIRKSDQQIYTNPYYRNDEHILTAKILSDGNVEIHYTNNINCDLESVKANIKIVDKYNNEHSFEHVTQSASNRLHLSGNLVIENQPFKLIHYGQLIKTVLDWRVKDQLFYYDGPLGVQLSDDGNSAILRVWSPSADNVCVRLYDKDNPDRVIRNQIQMEFNGVSVWCITLHKGNTGLKNLKGYYYHFLIKREDRIVAALDPYAKSMAPWNNKIHTAGKAAIVDPTRIGPSLDHARIYGYEGREDAIIYEVHVRDFTSDPSIEKSLSAEFGTFAAFSEKLDYIANLGVTHIQLLPVMSYFFCDETNNRTRLLKYASSNQNYSWGYDPHSFFSLSGFYSEQPANPEKRVEEFKRLIKEIHQLGIGVILDVVYNHTAKVRLLEHLEPNYYHYMNADGTTRRSFGGGRIGTTHKMARRLLIDSLKYWLTEFKVDGFRFDMMGDHDAETIQLACEEAKKIHPHVLMIGEGWRTYMGDETVPEVIAADQDWAGTANSVGCFSDEFRNEIRSGYGCEGEQRFITNGPRNIQRIFSNITAMPGNFKAGEPGDVVQYIEAHDNLTLHDVIGYSLKKDPAMHTEEIHRRIRLGYVLLLTSQGTVFIHAGSEYGRTKQFLHPDYEQGVKVPPYKSTYVLDEQGAPVKFPYFIHDSYNASDSINRFDWQKALNKEQYPVHSGTRNYVRGLIQLRRSVKPFHYGTKKEIEQNVQLVPVPEIDQEDVAIVYRVNHISSETEYYVFINADQVARTYTMSEDLTNTEIITDSQTAGVTKISKPIGIRLTDNRVILDPLTAVIIRKNTD